MSQHQPKLLIVEDEPGLRAGLCAAVQTLNCRALSAPGLEVARRQLASESIDCVLLDIRLRDGDGRRDVEARLLQVGRERDRTLAERLLLR